MVGKSGPLGRLKAWFVGPRARFRFRKICGLFFVQGATLQWRTIIRWQWPRLDIEYVRWPKLEAVRRPEAEYQSAQTPADWRANEQSDNLETRK